MSAGRRLTYAVKTQSVKDAALILASALIGYLCLTTVPRMAALILAVPALWTLAGSRYSAFAVMLAYKLAASRGLFGGAAVFLSEDHTPEQAAFLYFSLSFGAALPFLLWHKEGKRKAACLVLAFTVAYVLPPFSLIGIINPLMASGTIFRGLGFAGMLAALSVYACCAVSRKTAYAFFLVTAVLTAVLPESWYTPPAPEGFMGVDTSFGRLGSGSFNFTRDFERSQMIFSDLRKRGVSRSKEAIIVLPETIAGKLYTPGLELWRGETQRLLPEKTVIFGAEIPADGGMKYDNAAVMLSGGDVFVSRQRIPVPYSMYRGPSAETGANLHLSESGVLPLPDGRKAAVIICYETFLTWPYLVSMLQRPGVIITISNVWWCRDTSLPATMKTAASLWALTFGVPAVYVRNI